MFTSRCPSRMYASTGVIRGEPSFVSVPTRTNWNRSISSRPCDAISGAACSNSSQVSTAEAKQMSPAGGGGSFVVGGAPEQAAAEAKEPRDPSGRGAFFVLGGGSRMVKVEAVVVRERVETVIDAVEEETRHVGVTVVEAIGHGRERGVTHEYRGRVFESRFLPKALLTFVVEDGIAPAVVSAIADAARSGNDSGDGLVWTSPVDNVTHNRTGIRLEELEVG